MVHFMTFLVLLVGGIQPASVLAGVTARIDLDADAFQRRQTIGGGIQESAQCQLICNPINGILTSGVSHANL